MRPPSGHLLHLVKRVDRIEQDTERTGRMDARNVFAPTEAETRRMLRALIEVGQLHRVLEQRGLSGRYEAMALGTRHCDP